MELNKGFTYSEFLKESGLTQHQVQEMTDFDNIMVDPSIEGTKVKWSSIHEKGMFATKEFTRGDIVGKALYDYERSNLGRYTNHSDEPNMEVVIVELGVELEMHAIKDIQIGDELTVCYMDGVTKQKELFNENK